MEIDVIAAEKHIRETRTSFHGLRVPSAPGVYAFFLKDFSDLKSFASCRDGIIYVGRSSDLAQRDFETHFDSEGTGFSTLRRSLGAILKHHLHLCAIPRSSGPSASNLRCYRFVKDGEDRLTEWMCQNLEIGVCIVDDPKPLEADLINRVQPPLNLTGWPNPYRQEIKALRKVCVEETRSRWLTPRNVQGASMGTVDLGE